jgi:3-oxoacyl-[acyl-carrier protein] reductase
MSDVKQLAGKWAVVTGASKGIGQAIAARLVQAGANVIVVARGQADLDAAAARMNAAAADGQSVIPVVADASEPEDIRRVLDVVRDRAPGLDIVVANAGTGSVHPLLDLSIDEWDRIMRLNLTGTFHWLQQGARLMQESAGTNRAILVISSVRALGVRPGRLAYSVSKAALNQLVRGAAYELGPLGIRVNALSPGLTATELAMSNREFFDEQVALLPIGRAGQPADMGETALFLVSPASSFITGANLVADGGESLW